MVTKMLSPLFGGDAEVLICDGTTLLNVRGEIVASVGIDHTVAVHELAGVDISEELAIFAEEYCHTTYEVLERCLTEQLLYDIVHDIFLDMGTNQPIAE